MIRAYNGGGAQLTCKKGAAQTRILKLRGRGVSLSLVVGVGCLGNTDKQKSFQMDGLTFQFSAVKMKIKQLVCPHLLCFPSPTLSSSAARVIFSNLNLMVPPGFLLHLRELVLFQGLGGAPSSLLVHTNSASPFSFYFISPVSYFPVMGPFYILSSLPCILLLFLLN